MTLIALEIYLALMMALAAVFATGFFEPVQELRESFVDWAFIQVPTWAEPILTPLYCSKCLAFWSSALLVFLPEIDLIQALRVALMASVLAFLIDPILNSDDE